jgi:hypothetical protein
MHIAQAPHLLSIFASAKGGGRENKGTLDFKHMGKTICIHACLPVEKKQTHYLILKQLGSKRESYQATSRC